MPDIIAESTGTADDGIAFNTSVSSWADVRGSTSDPNGTFFGDSQSQNSFSVYNVKQPGRGGQVWRVYRSFFAFDLSGESGTASAVTLNIRGQNGGSTDTNSSTIYAVALSSAMAGNSSDFGKVFSSGTTLGTLYGSVATSTGFGYQVITGNSDMRAAVNSAVGSSTLYVGVMGYYDYNNSEPVSAGALTKITFQFAESSVGKQPFLGITYASGYTHKVLGVAAADIAAVKGIATANIAKVNGV